MIHAEAHSDDRNVEIDFDATPWFQQATDDEILDLVNCDWGGDFPADEVARYFESTELKRLFDYLAAAKVGFECNVCPDMADAWLKEHRPHLRRDQFGAPIPLGRVEEDEPAGEIMMIDERTGADTDRVLGTHAPADIAVAQFVLNQPISNDGRSGWRWFRLQNGDLILGVFPRAETYEATEADPNRP